MPPEADTMPDFLQGLRDRPSFPLGFATRPGGFEDWRAAGLTALQAAVGPALNGEAQAETIGASEAAGVTQLRLRMAFPTGAVTEALMLIPPGRGPHPAVLLLHDHGSEFRIGKEKVIAPWDDPAAADLATGWQQRFYGGASLGHALVARGYAVLAADALGWGARQCVAYDEQQALAANLMQFGLTLAGVVAAEDAQALRWLARHRRIDPQRVGAMGFSFGGFRAWQVAALCPQLRAAVSACWMGRLQDMMQPGNNQLRGQSAYYMLHPALGGQMDYPDMAALAAPRAMQFLAGATDRHFPRALSMRAHDDLHRIWAAAGAPDRLDTAVFDHGHLCSPELLARACEFIDRHL